MDNVVCPARCFEKHGSLNIPLSSMLTNVSELLILKPTIIFSQPISCAILSAAAKQVLLVLSKADKYNREIIQCTRSDMHVQVKALPEGLTLVPMMFSFLPNATETFKLEY